MVNQSAGLNRDLLKLNNVLRFKRGQERTVAADAVPSRLPAASLPQWIRVGARCCYVSKASGAMHGVKVQKIDERQQVVVVVFEEDKNNGKKVPFLECSKYGDGTLRPVFKATAGGTSSSAPSSASSSRPTVAGPRKSVASDSAANRAPESSTSPKVAADNGQLSASAQRQPSPPPAQQQQQQQSSSAQPSAQPQDARALDPYNLAGLDSKKSRPSRQLFLPRAVALGTGSKKSSPSPVGAPMGPALPPGQTSGTSAGASEISDDDVVAVDKSRDDRSPRRKVARTS